MKYEKKYKLSSCVLSCSLRYVWRCILRFVEAIQQFVQVTFYVTLFVIFNVNDVQSLNLRELRFQPLRLLHFGITSVK